MLYHLCTVLYHRCTKHNCEKWYTIQPPTVYSVTPTTTFFDKKRKKGDLGIIAPSVVLFLVAYETTIEFKSDKIASYRVYIARIVLFRPLARFAIIVLHIKPVCCD